MTDELQRALEHMDLQYQAIRRARESAELTAAEGRRLVLRLAHHDDLGRTWRIDLARSGQAAAFAITADAVLAGDPGLEALAARYTSLLAAFEEGRVPADDAKQRVLELSYLDGQGRTWRIDTTRSGHTARFLMDTSADDVHISSAADAPAPAGAPPGALTAHPTTRRGRPTAKVFAWAAAVALVIGSLAYLASAGLDDDSSDAAAAVTSATTDPTTSETTSPTTSERGTAPSSTSSGTLPSTVPVDTTIPADLITTEGKTADDIPFETPVEFGRSVQDRPLVLERLGTAGGARVLVVGVIHGNEQAGLEITALLRTMELGTNIDLWLVTSMNPDGMAADTRQNARAVDLNRNFTVKWEPIGTKGDWQYAGPSAASEPETQAMMTLARMVEPDLVIWYHQDYFRIEPKAGREGEIRSRYAGLVDLPLLPISGGSYSGTANGWVRTVIATRGMSMTVELGPELRAGEAQAHAEAVLTIVDEYWTEGGSPPSSAMP